MDDDCDLIRVCKNPFSPALLLLIEIGIKIWDFWSYGIEKTFHNAVLLNDLFSRHHRGAITAFTYTENNKATEEKGENNSLISICDSHCAPWVIWWSILWDSSGVDGDDGICGKERAESRRKRDRERESEQNQLII